MVKVAKAVSIASSEWQKALPASKVTQDNDLPLGDGLSLACWSTLSVSRRVQQGVAVGLPASQMMDELANDKMPFFCLRLPITHSLLCGHRSKYEYIYISDWVILNLGNSTRAA